MYFSLLLTQVLPLILFCCSTFVFSAMPSLVHSLVCYGSLASLSVVLWGQLENLFFNESWKYIYIKLSFRIYWIFICKRFSIVLECVITNLRYDETSLSFHWQDHPSIWTQRSCDNCWCQCPLHKQWGRTSKGRNQWQLEHVTWGLFSRAGAW